MPSETDADAAWQRLIEMQREVEDSRLMAGAAPEQTVYLAQLLVERARALVRALRSDRGQPA